MLTVASWGNPINRLDGYVIVPPLDARASPPRLSQPRPTPRTHCNADRTAMRLVKERKTSIKIHTPFLDTAHRLLGGSNGFGWTCVLTNSAIRAEGIDLESALRRGRKWSVRQHRRKPER